MAPGCTRFNGANELTVWTNKQPAERETLKLLLREFEAAHPGVSVREQYFETEELRDKFINAVLAGKGPDLIFGPSDPVGPLVVMKTLRPLNDWIAPIKSELSEDAFTEIGGEIYQVSPTVGNHLMLIYNKKLVPDAPHSFDELVRMGQKFIAEGAGETRYGLVWNFVEPYFLVPFFTGFGGRLMNEEHQPTLNTQAMVKAIEFIIGLQEKSKIIPRDCDYNTAEAIFKEQKSPFIINGPWALSGYAQAGIDYGIAPIPLLPGGGRPSPMKSGLGYSINVNVPSEREENARALMLFLVGKSAQEKSYARDKTLPTDLSLRNSPAVAKDPMIVAMLEALKPARFMPVHPNMRIIWDQMRPSYQRAMLGKVTAEAAAATMQEEATEAIQKLGRSRGS